MTGLCQCGCGEPTKIARQDNATYGYKKGEPLPYLLNHRKRKFSVDYVVDEETGCWNWQRTKNGRGYGLRWNMDAKRNELAHRVCYQRERGEIPEEWDIDHTCRNTSCVNPDHLEAVPHSVNVQRGYDRLRAEGWIHPRLRAAA